METPGNSLLDAQPPPEGGRSKSVDAGMLDVPPLCYKNPNRVRRSRSSTSLHFSSIQSTYNPPNGTPTQSPSNPSAGEIDSVATDAEEKTPAFGSRNLKIKITKVSPRGSLYELNPAALRLNMPSPICWNWVEDAHSEMPRKNDQVTLDGGIQRCFHKSPFSPTSRSLATLPGLNVVGRSLKKPASTRGSKRHLAAAAELRAFTEGAFEWLAEQVLLEGFDIDGNSIDEEPSIPSPSVGTCDVWDFSPPTPSNLPLPLVPAPCIVDERDYVQDSVYPRGIEREICHHNSSEHGFDPQVPQSDTSDVEANSSTYSMKNCDSLCEDGNSIMIAVDTRPCDRNPALLIFEQDPRGPSTEANNELHLESPGSLFTYGGVSQYHPSTGSSQTPSPLTASEPRIESNVAAIPDTTVSTSTSICCPLKCLYSELAVEAQTPSPTTPGRPRANTVDGFVRKSRSIFDTPRRMVSKAMSEAVQIMTPRPSLATLSSLARPRALSSPQAIGIATQAFSTTENTESTFVGVSYTNWDSTTTGEKVIWAPQRILPGISHADGRVTKFTSILESSNPFPFASVGPSRRSGRVPVSPELCKGAKNFSRPTRLL